MRAVPSALSLVLLVGLFAGEAVQAIGAQACLRSGSIDLRAPSIEEEEQSTHGT